MKWISRSVARMNLPARFLTTLLALALWGCGIRPDEQEPVSFTTKYAPIEFSFPAGWRENPDEHPYDLQCFSRFQEMTTGVFAYKADDLDDGSVPIDIFERQIMDIESKRDNWKDLEDFQEVEDGNRRFSTVTCTGERNGTRNCYRFTLIEFLDDPDQFAMVLQTCLPETWNESEPTLEAITRFTALPSGTGKPRA